MSYYKDTIDKVINNYNKLIFVVGKDNIEKIFKEIDCKGLNLNMLLTQELIQYPIKKRISKVSDLTQDIINNYKENIIIIKGIEVLFTKHLNVDCIELLKANSRNKILIIQWPGDYKDDILIYASGHIEEYKYKVNNEFTIIGGKI